MNTRPNRRSEAGVSLLEILIAVSILGITFAGIFSSLSSALRAASRLDQYRQAVGFATNRLDELVLDPALGPDQELAGVSSSGMRWRARTVLLDSRPGAGPDRPIQLMRVVVEVLWSTPRGAQSFALQTLKLRIPPAPANP